jgi:hypothetical protein
MSYRHMHVTGHLGGVTGTDEFIAAARGLKFFAEVIPVVSEHGGRVIAVALWSKDRDGFSDEEDMPKVAARLSGILSADTEIVSAWEGGSVAESFGRQRQRQVSWPVPGRGGTVIQGETVLGQRALSG